MTADDAVQAIQEQIRTILSGVAGIGVIHSYNRWAINLTDIIDKFKDAEGKINTCMFVREKMAKRAVSAGVNTPHERAHVFKFRCIAGLQDAQATGETFGGLLSRIEEAFDRNYTLNGACMTTSPGWGPMDGLSGMQLDLVDERMFGKAILCHYAELSLCAIERHAT